KTKAELVEGVLGGAAAGAWGANTPCVGGLDRYVGGLGREADARPYLGRSRGVGALGGLHQPAGGPLYRNVTIFRDNQPKCEVAHTSPPIIPHKKSGALGTRRGTQWH